MKRLLSKRTVGLAVWCVCLSSSVGAQVVAHNNALEMKKEAATHIRLEFALNLTQVLHAVLAPQTTYADFLQRCAELSDTALTLEMAKASKALTAKSWVTLPSGSKTMLTDWQLPDKQLLRDACKAGTFILQMPPGAASHLDPMPVQAQVQSKRPINRVQLQLHPALHPILVGFKNDKFWLTEQIPMALVDLD